jgi:hypothetical protein
MDPDLAGNPDLADNTGALATFVVEARIAGPSSEGSPAVVAYTTHHMEGDQTSPALGTGGQLTAWIQDRVRAVLGPGSPTSDLPEPRSDQVHAQKQTRPLALRRQARLRLTHLHARSEGPSAALAAAEISLLTKSAVILDAAPVILGSHGVLEGSEGLIVRCRIRCRLRGLYSQAVIERSWGEGTKLRPGCQGVELTSPPLAIPSGFYQGEIYLESPDDGVRPDVLALPMIKIA